MARIHLVRHGGLSQSPPTPIPCLWHGIAPRWGWMGRRAASSFSWPRRGRTRRDRMGQSPHHLPPCPSHVGGLPLRLRLELPLMMSGGCMCGPPRGSAGLTRLAAPHAGCKSGLLPVDALVSDLARTPVTPNGFSQVWESSGWVGRWGRVRAGSGRHVIIVAGEQGGRGAWPNQPDELL